MTCDFSHEGFCILQNEYPELERCSKAKGKLQTCVAKESDLIEICPECWMPVGRCGCGANIVLVKEGEAEQ